MLMDNNYFKSSKIIFAINFHQKRFCMKKKKKEKNFKMNYFHFQISWALLSGIIFFVTCYGCPYCFQTGSFCF